MINSSDLFGPSRMIINEQYCHIVFKFQSYILFLNKATRLSELFIKEHECRI